MAYYSPSGESEAVTIRPSATSLLAFDSDDRYADYNQRRIAPSYPFRVLIQKGEALLTGFFKRIALSEFRLNWTLPNVSRGWGTNIMNVIYTGASTITATSGSGTIQTYTCGNSFQAGQSVSVVCTTAGYNLTNATILTATATNFTVAGTFAGATGTGTATIGLTATITGASATTTNGITSITYTAANRYVVGQIVQSVTGLSPAGFNITNLRIVSATPTQFVVALPVGTVLSGSSTGTGTALVGLTRQITFGDGFYDTLSIAEYLTQNMQSVIPGFQAFVNDLNNDQISCLPPIDLGLTTYGFYFDPVNAPVQYGRGFVTAGVGAGAGSVVYTCANTFVVGQTVSVTGLNTSSGASLNLTGVINSATPTLFSIANNTVGIASGTQVGTATADAKSIFPNTSLNYRQLIDMINFPYATQYFGSANNTLFSGIPNMRATDYMDVVCSQLTQNQQLRDSTTLPVTRDTMCRVYLDESTQSQSNVTTINNGIASPTTLVLTALVSVTGNVAIFSTSTTVTSALQGVSCVIANVTGGLGWNGQGTIVSTDTITPFAVAVAYDDEPTGVPVFSGTSSLVAYTSTNTTSRPQTVWDARMNGVTPFCLYRQFQNPKQIRWSGRMPLANCVFELYDDNGRSIQELWDSAYPISSVGALGRFASTYANSFTWNFSCLLSED